MAIKTLLGSILACLMALPAFASDLTVPQSTLYPYRNSLEIQDDFMTGTTGSGSIGSIGFSSSGTITTVAGTANRPGVYRADTTAVSGTLARFSGPQSNLFLPAAAHSVLWVVQLNTNDANTTVRIGAQNSTALSPPDHGIYFEKLDGDTNWFCITRAATVETRTDSTIAVNTSFNTFAYNRNSSGVAFFINNVQVCSHTATIPTSALSPDAMIVNSTVAAKTFDVDYFQMKITGLVR